MCGIAGFITDNKKYDSKRVVSDMLDILQHRGPNQKGLKTFGNVTLGMTRLSIIDKNQHTIPYEDDNNLCSIVYNGEVYNHDSIKQGLKAKYNYKTSSDAESILYNFIEKKTKSFEDYNGMYAFAIHDSNEDTTYIVRDRAGEKPLYYTKGKDFIAFASEIKALLKIVKPRYNNSAISYKAYEFTTGAETLFKDVFALECGEFLKIKNVKLSKHEYWKVWNNLIDVKDNKKKILQELTDIIEDSVILRTKNCVHKYGCFISGGIDSALVACIAKPDYIYTVHYDYDNFNELEYAKLVSKKTGKGLVVVTPQKADFLRANKKITYYLDTPCTWTSFSIWMLLERARKNIKVIMTGDGADELFGGYHRYHLLNNDEQIHNLEAMKEYSYLIERYYGSPVDRYVKLINRCDNQFDNEVNEYLNKSVGYFFNKVNGDVIHAMGLNDFYSTMQVLLHMTDRLCMAFNVENRSPFLDHRLIQFAFSIPSKYKIKNGNTKWILKEISKKFIPHEIVQRVDKRGFSAPINRWFAWDNNGVYNRTAYKNMVLKDWKKTFLNGNALEYSMAV